MLLAKVLSLTLASGDELAVKAMTASQQSDELLQLGALLCYPPQALKLALWKSADDLRGEKIAPVLFALSPEETATLIAHVASFFARAAAADYDIEAKPDAAEPCATPAGK